MKNIAREKLNIENRPTLYKNRVEEYSPREKLNIKDRPTMHKNWKCNEGNSHREIKHRLATHIA
jgi:hypothetical protein